jgi:hypothetical protein
MAQPGTNDRRYVHPSRHVLDLLIPSQRINWSGSALSAFYGAVRRALVMVIVLRALGLLGGLAGLFWWLFYGR